MDKKNYINTILLICIGFIVSIGLWNSFKTSDSLKSAINSIDSAQAKVDKSMLLLKDQKLIIDSIKNSNNKLLEDIDRMEEKYGQLKKQINDKFNKTYSYLDETQKKVDSIAKTNTDPE